MQKEYNIKDILNNLDFSANMLTNIGHGLMLTNREIAVLKKYHISYEQCLTLKEILSKIEYTLNEEDDDCEDLELVSESISERDYYQNTNK